MGLKKYDVKKMLFVFLTIMLCILAIGSKYLIERGFLGSFFQSKKAKELNILSAKTRDSLKDVSINMIEKKPILGIGFRNFLIKRNEYSKIPVERAYVHNIYLLLGAETGILTLAIFIAMVLISLINTIKSSLNPATIISICMIVSFLLIGFFDHYPISSTLGRLVLFLNIAFLNFSKSKYLKFKLSHSILY